jgi:hypothetical protein
MSFRIRRVKEKGRNKQEEPPLKEKRTTESQRQRGAKRLRRARRQGGHNNGTSVHFQVAGHGKNSINPRFLKKTTDLRNC